MSIDPRPPFSDRLPMRSAARFPAQRLLTLALTMLLAVAAGTAVLLWILLTPDAVEFGRGAGAAAPARAAPAATAQTIPLPPVEPVQYLELPREDARLINERTPFTTAPVPAAAALRVAFAQQDLDRATDCLAAAGYYEAGDDGRGQQAVAQVVINRMRHPAFPATVCGVVFQGAERTTGCQFSFTCDGAMDRRRPSPEAWARARGVALAALGGYVFAPVGYATHYHTDWVVPNWSRHVDKVARIDTHLFFRWLGRAGTPPAFHQAHGGGEPRVPQLAALSTAHSDEATEPGLEAATAEADAVPEPIDAAGAATAGSRVPEALLRGNALLSDPRTLDRFDLRTGAAGVVPGLALVALDLCRLSGGPACTVAVYPDASRRRPDFYYLRDSARGVETVQWNCAKLRRAVPAQCLPDDFRP